MEKKALVYKPTRANHKDNILYVRARIPFIMVCERKKAPTLPLHAKASFSLKLMNLPSNIWQIDKVNLFCWKYTKFHFVIIKLLFYAIEKIFFFEENVLCHRKWLWHSKRKWVPIIACQHVFFGCAIEICAAYASVFTFSISTIVYNVHCTSSTKQNNNHFHLLKFLFVGTLFGRKHL